MPAPVLVIVNPKSQSGRTARSIVRLKPALERALGAYELEHTRGPRDAARIAREAVRAGVERLVVAGGDGTLSEVVSGVLAADLGRSAEIAVLPMGSGCDFARTMEVSRDPEETISLLARGAHRRVDAGRIRYRDPHGKQRESYFLNVASFGLSGLTDRLVNSAPKHFGPTAAFAIGSLRAITRFRPPQVRVRVDGETFYQGGVNLVALANGRYFGSGMKIAPEADPANGTLEVVVVGPASKAALVGRFPSLYRGSHIAHPSVHCTRGLRVDAVVLEGGEGDAVIDVDGEALGELPIEVELLPGAIGLFGLPGAREAT